MSKRADKRTCGDGNISTPPGTAKKQKRRSSPEKRGPEMNFTAAKKTMRKIKLDLRERQNEVSSPTNNLIQYIQENITNLDTSLKKKTTVGVFGQTGAGKSSLLNAILGEKFLLPSGTLCACTSVIIQVEANVSDANYTAEIKFIPQKEWENEIRTCLNILREDDDKEDDDKEDDDEKDDAIFTTAKEKITALFRESLNMTVEELVKDDKFSEIKNNAKKITCEKASDLFDQIGQYVQHDDSNPGGCYWPVVKSVTIKVPKCKDFLEHIELVDLPGTGDLNNSRDEMWRSKLRECSAVWIVSEMNRAVSEKEAWKRLFKSRRDMAENGECSRICFICTKTDDIDPEEYIRSKKLTDEDLQITPQDSQYDDKRKSGCILHRNNQAKEKVKKKFKEQSKFQKHFKCDDNFLSVFTVSSKEFTKEDSILTPEQTEISKLKEVLMEYNNSHISQYISGALGILHLIQSFKESDTAMMKIRSTLHDNFKKNLDNEVKNLQACSDQIYSDLEELILQGVKESEENCSATAKKLLKLKKDGRGFHRILTALCMSDGFYRSRKGEQDLNRDLAKHISQRIEEKFSDFFPAPESITEKSLQANIVKCSVIQEDVIEEYENSPVLHHILKFLKTEENKLKTTLKQEIVERKKEIYASPSESIKTTMLPCYQSAALITGVGSMKKKQDMLLDHIESSKSEMFQKAKTKMLHKLRETLDYSVQKIRTGLLPSMEYSLLNTSTLLNMDVSKEIKMMEELQRSIQVQDHSSTKEV